MGLDLGSRFIELQPNGSFSRSDKVNPKAGIRRCQKPRNQPLRRKLGTEGTFSVVLRWLDRLLALREDNSREKNLESWSAKN
jgi:hypothetical protein